MTEETQEWPLYTDGVYSLELHGNRPLTLNKERTLHRMERAAIVKDYRESFGWMAKAQQVPPMAAIKVFATPLAKNRRSKQDVGACFPAVKAAIDGLVDANVLPDDTDDFVRALTFFPVEVGGVDGLRLTIEEVDHFVR